VGKRNEGGSENEGFALLERFHTGSEEHHSFRGMLNGLPLETGKSYASAMEQMQSKNMSQPDEKRSFDRGELELVTLGDVTSWRVVPIDIRQGMTHYAEPPEKA
jgi:hypothetical protein